MLESAACKVGRVDEVAAMLHFWWEHVDCSLLQLSFDGTDIGVCLIDV